jgi:hypothetical protein
VEGPPNHKYIHDMHPTTVLYHTYQVSIHHEAKRKDSTKFDERVLLCLWMAGAEVTNSCYLSLYCTAIVVVAIEGVVRGGLALHSGSCMN